MKKIFLTTIFITFSLISNSQNFKELFKQVEKFDTQEQFDSADKDIQKAVDYLLTHKYNEKSSNYFYALKSMIKWMDGTNKYAIIIGGKLTEDIGKKTLMMNMYMAGMAKFLLNERFENNRYLLIPKLKEGEKFNELDIVRIIQIKGAENFFDYLKNFSGEKPDKKLKKGFRKYEKGQIYQYMFD